MMFSVYTEVIKAAKKLKTSVKNTERSNKKNFTKVTLTENKKTIMDFITYVFCM